MTKNDAQANRIVFSYSYFMAGQKFMALKGNIRKMADLEGKVIATVAGSTYERDTKKSCIRPRSLYSMTISRPLWLFRKVKSPR
jgi:ABC-type amino acid transport substrate-binding protein